MRNRWAWLDAVKLHQIKEHLILEHKAGPLCRPTDKDISSLIVKPSVDLGKPQCDEGEQ